MKQDEKQRQQSKTREQSFLSVLESEFDFAPKFASALLEEAKRCLLGEEKGLKPGQVKVLLLPRNAPHGKALKHIAMKEVVWTIDAGQEDNEVQEQHGRIALRQTRIQRLLSEAIEQGAVATQEDLARVLQVEVRTVKRDCKAMRAKGIALPTRGNLKGIGRGQTHKTQIVGRWLQGETYDQIAHHTKHSLSCVKRYIQAFVRVMQLHRQGFTEGEISLTVQIGLPLVQQYVAIYEQNDTSFSRQRLQEQLERFSRAGSGRKKGVK